MRIQPDQRLRVARPWGTAVACLAAGVALGLGACGGGGGPTPQASRQGATQQEPPPATPPSPGGTSAQVQAFRLPADLSPGEVVEISGDGVRPWRIAQAEGQQVLTSNLPGAVQWQAAYPAGAAALWWTVATSQSGNTIVAAANAGRLYTSRDGGVTWEAGAGEPERNWTAVAVSAEGDRLAATADGGTLWQSWDGGRTWEPTLEAGPWVAVGLSGDGRIVAAAQRHGPIHISVDGGQTFAAGGPVAEWGSLAVSASGQWMVAGTRQGALYLSGDLGQTWKPLDAGAGDWYRVAMSANGQRIAAVDMGGWIHLTGDRGGTWATGFREGPVNALASSGDGLALAAAVPVDGGLPDGKVHVSTDGGRTWVAHLEDRTWRGVAFSGDGTTLVAAANGGAVHVSRGHRTTEGTAGGISGAAGDWVELVYLGDGRFSVRAASGSFTVD